MLKKLMILVGCLACATPLYALLGGRGYPAIGDLVKAHNLLIVRADAKAAVKVLYDRDQVRTYAVVCLKVLNGEIAKAGRVLAVDSESPLVDGRRYLLAGDKATLNGKPWPLFTDRNSAISLPAGLKLSSLAGKDKTSQVRTIIDGRIREVDGLIRRLQEERKQLAGLLSPKTPKPQRPTRADN